MADYSKLNIRFVNTGLNVGHAPSALDFGEWTTFKNAKSLYEGQLTSRMGFGNMSTALAAPAAILGIRKLNNSVNSQSGYFVKLSNGKVFMSLTGAGGTLTTTTPLYFSDTGVAVGATTFGSFLIERPSLSASAFLYYGDKNGMAKFGISGAGALITKNVGMTRPTGPPTFVVSAGGSLTASSSYNYRYTLYDKNTGTESFFNNTAATAASTTAVNKTITVTIPTETVDSATTHVRVYRQGGTLSTWSRISDDSATYAYTGTTINFADSASDLSLAASTLLDTLSDKPFSITQTDTTIAVGQPLPFLFGPFLGYVLACGDGKNPGLLYWTNKYNPDSQNPANNIEVSSPQDPLQNGFIYNGLAYVFSKEALYAIYPGVSESTFTPSKTSCSHGLWTPQAFCIGPQIYFLSRDGIYATAGGLEQAMTDDEMRPLFDPKQTASTINGIGVVDYTQTTYMFMAYYKNEIFFQYLGKDNNTHVLIYDVRYHRWRHMQGGFGINIRSIYVDEQTTSNLLLGGNDGNLYQETGYNDGGVAITTDIKTGLITLGAPLIHKEFGGLIVDLDPQSINVTINAYKNRGATLIDGGSGFTGRTSAAARTRFFISLADTFSEDIQLDFSWTTPANATSFPILHGYELLYRPEEPQTDRWALVGTTHGILGWQILRSGYFTYRSDGTLNLQIQNVLDNNTVNTYNYTLANANDGKRKTFVPFDPIRGKVFNYTLTLGTATYFRFYPEESEVHVKPWISSFGYSIINPFRGGGDPVGGQAALAGQRQGADFGAGGGGSIAPMTTGATPGFDFSGLGGGIPLGPTAHVPGSGPEDGDWQDWGSGRWGYGPPPGGPIDIPTGGQE